MRVEVDEHELRLGRERARERPSQEGALAPDDRATTALAERRLNAFGERSASLARRGQPAVPRIERDTHAFLAAEAVGKRRAEHRGGLREAREALFGDQTSLE